jgi:Ca2+-binding EF-hand superfamily protein
VKSELKRLSQQTRLQNNEDLIFIYFTLKSITKVNLMEIFSAITAYSEMTWSDKVRFSFKLFDFDGNKSISQDELFIMCKCFIDAVALLTGGSACSNLIIKEMIEKVQVKLLALDEYDLISLLDWVKENHFIFQMLNPGGLMWEEPGKSISCSPEVLKGRVLKSFDRRSGPALGTKLKKRTLSSFGPKKNLNFMIVVDGSPVTKGSILELKHVYDTASITGPPTGDLLKNVPWKGKNCLKGLAGLQVYPTFRRFLTAVFPKADNPQINRMLEMVNSKNYSVFPPCSEERVKSPKSRQAIRNFFKKIDTNGDGVIQFDELKNALEANFTTQAIEELFKEHSKNENGLGISDFTEMLEKK